MSLLQTENLGIHFGGLTALKNFNLELPADALSGLIGPNGAGKTTVFNILTGHYRPTSGDVRLAGESLIGRTPVDITRRGVARTFQNIRLFRDLSVLDNIRTAGHIHTSYTLWDNIWRTRRCREGEKKVREESMELLKIFGLEDVAHETAKNLPYGGQRRLEIARALAVKPRALLLDEPAAGMNPAETDQLAELILWVREEFKPAILLIEHDMGLVMKVCRHIHVLVHGEPVAAGSPEEIRNNPRVIEAYLGAEDDE